MTTLRFDKQTLFARFVSPSGKGVRKQVEVRTHPITGRACRIALARADEREPGTRALPPPPPDATAIETCPFCPPQAEQRTPTLNPSVFKEKRLKQGDSLLFPNLFPYGAYSAVSLFDSRHFVEIGMASPRSYADCLKNCVRYLKQIQRAEPGVWYMAITQNHLPSAGGSLVHPHLQVHADIVPGNHHRFLSQRAAGYFEQTGRLIFSDYLAHEKADGARYLGRTGRWEWLAAFAPEGFFELWAVLPEAFSLNDPRDADWEGLAQGMIQAQRFYRSRCRNGYNFGLLLTEDGNRTLELRATILARSNYAAWVRNDHTGFELIWGDMATFHRPEAIADEARRFWA